LPRAWIAIADALAMLGTVLPPPAVANLGAIEVAIDIHRAIDVHIDVGVAAPTPVPAAEQRARRREARAPQEAPRQRAGERIVGRRIGRVGPRTVGPARIVGWHVDHVRTGRL